MNRTELVQNVAEKSNLTKKDAEKAIHAFMECVQQALVVTQAYDPVIASDAKLALMAHYPDDCGIVFLHNLALPDESIRRIPLYELDRQKDIDHLTSVFVPAQE